MKPKLSWRRDKRERGLRAVCGGTPGWTLWYTQADGTEDWVAALRPTEKYSAARVYVVVVAAYGLPHRNTAGTRYWSDIPKLKKNLLKWVKARFKPV